MTSDNQSQQLALAAQVEELTRTLAHSTRDISNPRDSYAMLGELGAAVDHLAQAIDQLGRWHSRAEDGIHYNGEDGGGTGSARAAAEVLSAAANALRSASNQVGQAHNHNSVVRWYQEPQKR